jgi:hypothetical protein
MWDVALRGASAPRGSQACHHAARNRVHLLAIAREMVAGQGASQLTMDRLAVQLTAALDGPLLLYLSASDLTGDAPQIAERIARSWQNLVHGVCRTDTA